jgi:lysyl-tRNA synthetase class 1
MKEVFKSTPPVPLPYDFVNRAGDTKKMSASKGNGILMSEVLAVLPPEVARYFILRSAPDKLLFFDPQGGVVRLIDDYAELLAKPGKTESETRLVELSSHGINPTVSNIPFSHLVSSYQAALKDPAKTLEIIERTENQKILPEQQDIIKSELGFIEQWLQKWAPDDVKFELAKKVDANDFTNDEKNYLSQLADKIAAAPEDADGEWFHKAIYELKESDRLTPQRVFSPLYRAIIGKESGPRAGWFLSILPREWLVKRLKLEN